MGLLAIGHHRRAHPQLHHRARHRDRPTPGTVTVNGKPYGQHRSPLREVGAPLDANAVRPGRSARPHLMSEMSQTADQLLVIGRGHVIAAVLATDGVTITSPEAGMPEVSGTTAEHIGAVAFRNGLLVLLLLPGILSFIRLDRVETIVGCRPLPASSALLTTGAAETQGAYLSAQASLIVMAACAVVPLAAAAVTLHRRDV